MEKRKKDPPLLSARECEAVDVPSSGFPARASTCEKRRAGRYHVIDKQHVATRECTSLTHRECLLHVTVSLFMWEIDLGHRYTHAFQDVDNAPNPLPCYRVREKLALIEASVEDPFPVERHRYHGDRSEIGYALTDP